MERAEKLYSFSSVTEVGSRRKTKEQRQLFDFFLPKLAKNATVVEIGSGRGEFANEVRARGLRYIGVEPSSQLCAKLSMQGFSVIKDVVPSLPIKDGAVDLIHSYDLVEHLSDYREVMRFFAESHRVLKRGGFLSVIAPNYETIKQLFFQYEYQHSFVTTKNRVENMLEDGGFEISSSRCFLMSLSPRLKSLDRVFAHIALPILLNSLSQAVLRLVISEKFTFRLNKNLFDHVAVLGRKQ